MTDISGPDFITLLVSDLERSFRFYTQQIGWPPSPETRPNAHAFATKPIAIAIREAPEVASENPHPGQGIIIWLHTPDSTALYAELKRRGVPIVEELRKSPFGMIFSFQDPDGYVISVHDGG